MIGNFLFRNSKQPMPSPAVLPAPAEPEQLEEQPERIFFIPITTVQELMFFMAMIGNPMEMPDDDSE